MRMLRCALVLGLAVAMASTADAQGQGQRRQGQGQRPGGGFGMGRGMSEAMLLAQKSVQEDLKLSEDQVKKITEMGERALRGGGGFQQFQGLSREEIAKKMEEMAEESRKAIAEILKPEQVKRLKEIGFQVRQRAGMAALLADNTVADELKLTDEQKEKLRAFAEDGRKFREELGLGRGAGGGGGGFQRPTEEQQKKLDEFRKSTDEKITKMLTDSQKAKLKELAGAEFKGEISPFGGRRPGGGGGN